MICKIYGNQLTSALINDAKFIIFSFDGQYALVRCEVPLVDALEQYQDSDINSLYADPLYRQPCKDC
jgi:hypothetical protein